MEEMNTTTVVDKPEQANEEAFDKESWAAKKQAERTELFAKADAAAEKVAKSPEALRGVLKVMARFPSYSVNNALLIYSQDPQAVRVGDYEFWQKKGAQVKKNEKGIAILEPGSAYEREDGTIATGYNVKRVFDITQTNARPRQMKEPDMRSLLKALVYDSPVEIVKTAELPAGAYALYDEKTDSIRIREGLGESELFCALAVQMANASFSKDADGTLNKESATIATTFMILERYGVEPRGLEPSLSELAGNDNPTEIKAELGRIKETAQEITSRMDEGLAKERAQRESSKER